MITIQYPEVSQYVKMIGYGLIPLYVRKEQKYILLFKANKEIILTAKNNNGFTVFLVKESTNGTSYLGLITAFFDNPDYPMVLASPLLPDDKMLTEMKTVFAQESFDTYFFNENNYELLGARVTNEDCKNLSRKLALGDFVDSKILNPSGLYNKMIWKFSRQNACGSVDAYEMNFDRLLY